MCFLISFSLHIVSVFGKNGVVAGSDIILDTTVRTDPICDHGGVNDIRV